MKAIMWLGGLLILLGLLGLAIPRFTTFRTTDVASAGDITVQSKTISHHMVSQPLIIAALLLGIVFVGAGTYRTQTA